jgi:phage-related minor tail protein
VANRIMGITVEIGGDTTKLQTAIKSVNGQIKSTQQQLKDVDKLLKLDLGNTELLERQMSDVAESM